MNLREEINKLKEEGYSQQNAQARICQDIILDSIAKCHLSENITIKGGVVMRNISNDVRRATVDLDFDFIKKSINDDSIKRFVEQLNKASESTISIIGRIEELKQQDYKGKRVHLSIRDDNGLALTSKIDIGLKLSRGKDIVIQKKKISLLAKHFRRILNTLFQGNKVTILWLKNWNDAEGTMIDTTTRRIPIKRINLWILIIRLIQNGIIQR